MLTVTSHLQTKSHLESALESGQVNQSGDAWRDTSFIGLGAFIHCGIYTCQPPGGGSVLGLTSAPLKMGQQTHYCNQPLLSFPPEGAFYITGSSAAFATHA